MALVGSIHVEQGSKLPDFSLKDPSGAQHHSRELVGENGLLLVITCNHCPYAIAVWPRVIRLAREIRAKGVNTVAINPNIHPDYPADSPTAMQEKIAEWGIDFPYLADERQSVAKALAAQCTPDIYLYNGDGELYYHGRIDDYWKDESKVTQQELLPAVESMVAGGDAPSIQHPTIGCSIKWLDE
ncbi:MAG TPA: thioredoxin family protein [Mariprofundaceae bacterium]|nr:thioredoxin family protein [Mariprofundaceae bacterium]